MNEDIINLAIQIAEMPYEQKRLRLIELKLKSIQLESLKQILPLNEQMEALILLNEFTDFSYSDSNPDTVLDFLAELDIDVQKHLHQN